jgi:Ca2+-binding EF-hand superfamily protein
MWDNFEELEEKLSMPELIAILNASRKKTEREQHFAAAIQGIDLDKGKNSKEKTFAQIMREGMGGEIGEGESLEDDVLELNGYAAAQAGFGIGLGLSYERNV